MIPRIHPAAVPLAFAAAIALQAQTLPPSTQDRQSIANLEYQLSLPGVTASERREIELQITQLQYRINTRSPIQPLPTLAPYAPPGSTLPSYVTTSASMIVPVYGSCDADRGVIEYLRDRIKAADTQAERSYLKSQIVDLQRALSQRKCSQ
jgi:hypothetical protein